MLTNGTNEKYVPVVESLIVDFKRPALAGNSSEAAFSDHDVDAMIRPPEATGRYDFELDSTLRDQRDQVVTQAMGCCVLRTMAYHGSRIKAGGVLLHGLAASVCYGETAAMRSKPSKSEI